jgi:hypothetical protein
MKTTIRRFTAGVPRRRTTGWYYSRAILVASVLFCCVFASCRLWAHGVVGQRMFIEPLFGEDANIKNELDLPRVELLTLPDGSLQTFDAALEKALYPERWSVVVEQSHIRRHSRGETPVSGFDELEIGTKVAAYRSPKHELVLTSALFVTVPTGSRRVAEHHTAVEPALLFAKGLGDLKLGYLRPFAVQGDVGYEASASGERERNANYDMVLFYSVPYLNPLIRNANAGFHLEHSLRLGHSAAAIFGDMFPFVEFNGSTPVSGTPGKSPTFLRPGALYMGKYFQISAAADLPIRGAGPRQQVGAVILVDWFLD